MAIRLIRAKNMTGLQFGKLTVIEPVSRDKKNIFWKCKCECGGETIVSGSNLQNNKRSVKSCGCIPLKFGKNSCKWLGHEKVSGAVVSRIALQAKRRGHQFELDAKFLHDLFYQQQEKCAISGVLITMPETRKDIDLGNRTASLDRIDSSVGYIKSNVQWVHRDVNLMKQQFSESYFVQLCKTIAEYQGEK